MENVIRANGTEFHDSVGLLTGLLIGGLAGLGAMLLLAPQSGKKTRSQIKQKSTELQDRATGTFDDLMALSHYDNRIILVGTREKSEDRYFSLYLPQVAENNTPQPMDVAGECLL